MTTNLDEPQGQQAAPLGCPLISHLAGAEEQWSRSRCRPFDGGYLSGRELAARSCRSRLTERRECKQETSLGKDGRARRVPGAEEGVERSRWKSENR